MYPYPAALEELAFARQIADHANRLGVCGGYATRRHVSEHLGAVLADAVLQAGVSYRTVVRVRVERIHTEFPEASTLSGLLAVLEQRGASDFLLWNDPVKPSRFMALTHLMAARNVSTASKLKKWLNKDGAREQMLSLHGIGPKTFDYVCCLVGIDCIAIDRHVRAFALEAGVPLSDYDRLRLVFSCAADLLGISRRDFDAWIWQTMSARSADDRQLSLQMSSAPGAGSTSRTTEDEVDEASLCGGYTLRADYERAEVFSA